MLNLIFNENDVSSQSVNHNFNAELLFFTATENSSANKLKSSVILIRLLNLRQVKNWNKAHNSHDLVS